MPRFIATIVIEANNEKDAEEQLQAEPFRFVQNASISPCIDAPELKEARLVAEEVLGIVSTREGNLFAEDMREFIGRELDLTDAALLEAWGTIEQDRMKKEAGADVRLR